MNWYFFNLIVFFLFSFGQVEAQNVFSKRMHLGYPSVVLSGVEANDSCFYVTGLVADSIAPFNSGLLFMKYNWNGERLLVNTLLDSNKTYEAWGNTLTPLEDGNFILSAFSSYTEGLVIKLTPEGDTIFTSSFISPYSPTTPFINVRDMAIMNDGGYATASIINDDIDSNILLTKTDSMGAVLWQRNYGGSTTEIVHSLIATNDGGLLIGAGKVDLGLYMIKVDENGEEEWLYTAPIPLTHGPALEVIQLDNDDFIISSTKPSETPGGLIGPRPFFFRLKTDMEWDWEVDFSDSLTSFDNILVKILPLPDNEHFLAAGNGYVELSDGIQNVGKLIKASYEGDSIWTRYYNHTEKEYARNLLYDLEATPDGGFIMCGQATGIENPTPDNPNQQGWLLKVDEHGCLVPDCHLVSSTIELQKSSFDIKAYPNPMSAVGGDYLNVYFYHPNLKGEAVFQLVNTSGKIMLEFQSRHGDITHMIPVSGLASGTYWLTCRVGEEVLSRQVMVE